MTTYANLLTDQKHEVLRGLGLGLSSTTEEEGSTRGECMSPSTEGGHRRKGTQWVLSSMEVLFYQPAASIHSTSSSREAPSLTLQTISIGNFRINVTETIPILNPPIRRTDRRKSTTKSQSNLSGEFASQMSQSNCNTSVKSTSQCEPVVEGIQIQTLSRNCFETQSMCVTFFEKHIGNIIIIITFIITFIIIIIIITTQHKTQNALSIKSFQQIFFSYHNLNLIQ